MKAVILYLLRDNKLKNTFNTGKIYSLKIAPGNYKSFGGYFVQVNQFYFSFDSSLKPTIQLIPNLSVNIPK